MTAKAAPPFHVANPGGNREVILSEPVLLYAWGQHVATLTRVKQGGFRITPAVSELELLRDQVVQSVPKAIDRVRDLLPA